MTAARTAKWNRRQAIALMAAGALSGTRGAAETLDRDASNIRFPVGLARVAFRNVNETDAKAAFLTFLHNEKHFQVLGHGYRAEVTLYSRASAMAEALDRGELLLAIINSWDFVGMPPRPEYEPLFVIADRGRELRRFVLLTRRGRGLDTLASLRGRNLTLSDIANMGIGRKWLDTRLLREQAAELTSYFSELRVKHKPTDAVLPVFFGTRDACLVDEFVFDVMKDLNPQVGRELQRVAVSEPFPDVVVCLNRRGWFQPADRAYAVKTMRELHQHAAGRQLLTLFKISRMVAFDPTHLRTIRAVRKEYESLVAAHP